MEHPAGVPGLDVNYPVLVTERNGEYTLRIKELILVVRGRDLEQVYRQIVTRQRQVVQWATMVGSLAELPRPSRPVMASAFGPPRKGVRTILRKVKRVAAPRGNPPAA